MIDVLHKTRSTLRIATAYLKAGIHRFRNAILSCKTSHPSTWPITIASGTKQLIRILYSFRALLATAIIAVILFGGLDQTQEIYLNILIDRSLYWSQITCFVILFSVLTLFLWSMSINQVDVYKKTFDLTLDTISDKYILRLLPIAIGLSPLLGVIGGVLKLTGDPHLARLRTMATVVGNLGSDPDSEDFIRSLKGALIDPTVDASTTLTAARISLGAISICIGLLVLFMILRRPSSLVRLRQVLCMWVARSWPLVICLSVACVLIFAAPTLNAGHERAVDFSSIPRVVGPLAIAALFLICFAGNLQYLTAVYNRYGFPLVSALVLIAVAGSYTNLNDNHAVRIVDAEGPWGPAPDKNAVPALRVAFNAWFDAIPAAHKQLFKAKGKPYPVFIVAAQGGGLYAADLAAITLARLYDQCPIMKYHIFAVSSVSGGSLGAGLVASLLQLQEREREHTSAEETCHTGEQAGWLEARSIDFLSQDFLSPVFASALFPDFAQRFIPWPPISAFDRASSFEASLEETWSKVVDRDHNMLRKGFRSHWAPGGPAPMLFFNATSVETGEPVVISPSTLSSEDDEAGRKTIYSFMIPSIEDLPMSTAISISARFPGILPSATIPNEFTKEEIKSYGLNSADHRFVDGGYVENTGIETANDIIDQLLSGPKQTPTSWTRLVITRGVGDEAKTADVGLFLLALVDRESELSLGHSAQFSEFLAPIQAVLRARQQRGQAAANRSRSVQFIYLDHEYFNLPLGWLLAKRTQGLIAAQVGRPGLCTGRRLITPMSAVGDKELPGDFPGESFGRFDLVNALIGNSCTLCTVLRIAQGNQGVVNPDGCRTVAKPN